MSKRSIDQVKPEWTRDYGYWLLKKPRPDGKTRGVEQINNSITEITKMYHQVAVRDRTSVRSGTRDNRLKQAPEDSYKKTFCLWNSMKDYGNLCTTNGSPKKVLHR